MEIFVLGMGWITREGFGSVRTRLRESFAPGEDRGSVAKKGVFSHPFKNFGRMDAVSRTTACAVAMALRDAGIGYEPGRKQDIGLVGTNREGSLLTDRDYFRDYLAGGRKLSRGNLFIYTLPSSGLGESAIHFGLQGPLLYTGAAGHRLLPALDTAASLLTGREAETMLAGSADDEEGLFLVLGRGDRPEKLCTLPEARVRIASTPAIAGIVQKFSV